MRKQYEHVSIPFPGYKFCKLLLHNIMIDALQSFLFQFNISQVVRMSGCMYVHMYGSFEIYLNFLNLEISYHIINKKMLFNSSCMTFIFIPCW